MLNSATQVTGQRRDHGKYCRNNIMSLIFSLLEKIPVPMELTELMETDTRHYGNEEETNTMTSESSQNPLQHPPAGFGECPSPWQQGASPLCLVSGHGYGLRSGVWGVPSQRILGGLAGVGVPTCGPGGLPWTCLPPPPHPDKHGAV